MVNRALLVAVLVGSAPAVADDVTLERCEKGARFAMQKDLPRAMLYLEGCESADLPADRGPAIRATLRETKKKVKDALLAKLSVVSEPSGVAFEIDALPGETLTTDATVYVPAGKYTVTYKVGDATYTKDTVLEKYATSAVILEGVAPPKPAAPKDTTVSFEDEAAPDQLTGPPPDIKRPSMIDGKYLRKPGARLGPELEDPLSLGTQRSIRPWIGLRLGGGIYDDSMTSAAWRPTVAATGRFRLARRLFASARLDWSRRGGDAGTSIDTAGINAGVGYTLLATRGLQVSAIGQLRGELHFADSRGNANDAMDVSRTGAGVSAGIEVAFWTTPLTAGLRAEQGLTELVPGARDRALLLELGVDWR